jgi:hypothetical protein
LGVRLAAEFELLTIEPRIRFGFAEERKERNRDLQDENDDPEVHASL